MSCEDADCRGDTGYSEGLTDYNGHETFVVRKSRRFRSNTEGSYPVYQFCAAQNFFADEITVDGCSMAKAYVQ